MKSRKSLLPLMHHSDRGLQYCSQVYQNVLAKHNIKPSMTDECEYYQNTLAERINGILKNEFFIYKYNDGATLEKLIKESIIIYNTKRPHLSLMMKIPNFINQKTSQENLTG